MFDASFVTVSTLDGKVQSLGEVNFTSSISIWCYIRSDSLAMIPWWMNLSHFGFWKYIENGAAFTIMVNPHVNVSGRLVTLFLTIFTLRFFVHYVSFITNVCKKIYT